MKARVLVAVTLLVLLIGGGLIAALGGIFTNDPEEVSLSNTTDAPSSGTIDFDGTWTVDNDSGSLDAEPPTSTFAGYRIDEELGGIGANTAVGRTQNVEGAMTIAGNKITDVDLTVDMTSLKSDRDMRDNTLRNRGLETDTHPTATFKLSEPITVADEPGPSERIDAEATGAFTLHGVTKQVTIPIQARWSGDRLTVTSSFDVVLADYDIERPTTARVLSIAEQGKVEMQLFFAKSP
jgi:polyisoprenoid-binding protein YceI